MTTQYKYYLYVEKNKKKTRKWNNKLFYVSIIANRDKPWEKQLKPTKWLNKVQGEFPSIPWEKQNESNNIISVLEV